VNPEQAVTRATTVYGEYGKRAPKRSPFFVGPHRRARVPVILSSLLR